MGASASIDQVQIICSNVERAVPRTPAGDSDVKNCDRTKLQEEISRAEGNVKAFYEAAWATCVADDLLLATAELQDEFSPADPPRCALPEGATVEALVALASEHAEAMHAALERPVKESGGAYYQGPRKGMLRIKEKAEADYEGDVARVVDVERATGVYDTANDFNAAISKLRATARGGELVIIRCKDNLPGGESGYRDVKLNVALGHSEVVKGVAVFPDGRHVVSGSSDKTVKVWDAATGECVATLAGHSHSVMSVAVFPDGRRVVSGSFDKTALVKVWGC